MSKILVCDDSAIDRRLISNFLREDPQLEVRESVDGAAALSELAANPVDLVVTDLAMPRTDGLELVREVKSRWPYLPVVLVTGQGSEETAIEALRCGAASYSPKAALATDLLRTVAFVLDVAGRLRGVRGTPEPDAEEQSGQEFFEAHLLDNDCRLIGPLIERLQEQLPAWSEDDRLQIGMALAEALTNAMHHGNLEVSSSLRQDDDARYHELIRERRALLPWSARRVHISSRLGPDEIRVRIRDEGPGFQQSAVPDPTLPENLTRVSGRGLLLIRSFMDEVRHYGCGNELEMIKRRR